jgi:hypothetical protein
VEVLIDLITISSFVVEQQVFELVLLLVSLVVPYGFTSSCPPLYSLL